MINDRNILCISSPAWESTYASTTVQLMKEMAMNNKVLFVQNPFTIKDVADGVKGKKNIPFRKVFGLRERLKTVKIGENSFVYVLTPPMILTINFLPKGALYQSLVQLNGWIIRHTIKKYLRKLGMEADLIHLVSFTPALGLALGRKFNEKLLLYWCYDEISAAPHLMKHGIWQEKEFAGKVDAMIVTSQGLYDQKCALSKKCYLIKNAANFTLFSAGFNPEITVKKKVGFIGGIDRRLDYAVLEHLIANLPDIEFTFIGRVVFEEGREILSKYNNVILEGSKDLTELPGELKQFSVGIIPFRKTEFIKTVYPLKMNEYLAAGLPVVTTAFSNLDDFTSVVRIAENKEEFLQFVKEEIESDTIEKKRQRQEVARLNSWEHRADELSDAITELEMGQGNTNG